MITNSISLVCICDAPFALEQFGSLDAPDASYFHNHNATFPGTILLYGCNDLKKPTLSGRNDKMVNVPKATNMSEKNRECKLKGYILKSAWYVNQINIDVMVIFIHTVLSI